MLNGEATAVVSAKFILVGIERSLDRIVLKNGDKEERHTMVA